jgi:TetR/AcrR family transcriptional regulator
MLFDLAEEVMVAAQLQDKQDIGVRVRLLTAATELFASKGYASTTVREIVNAAGVTKPVLYYYFQNKEGIYLELMRETFAKFETLLNRAKSETGPASRKILALCGNLMVLLDENLHVARVMYAIYYGPPQGAPFFDCDVFHFKFQDTLQEFINEGIATGEFRDGNALDMTLAVLGAINIAIDIELSHPDMALGNEGLARVVTIIFDGVRVKASL